MFGHLNDLLSFDNTVKTAPSSCADQQDLNNGATYTASKSSDAAYPSNVANNNSSNVYLAPDEPMEEIPFEVSRTHGVILPPPHGSMRNENVDIDAEVDDNSSSNAIVNGESKQKRGFAMWGSSTKSKSGTDDDDDSAVAAVPVTTNSKTAGGEDSEEQSDGELGKVVGIAPIPEKAPSSSSYRYEPESNKKKWLICLAILLVIVAIVVPCAILIPRNNAAQTNNTASNTSGGETSDNTGGDGTEGGGSGTEDGTEEETEAPTAAPTPVNAELPAECEPAYETLDACLLNEITPGEADSCIDCVFGFLPDNTGPCEALEASVCNVLAQCECLSCTDELEEYLDCQSECDLNCAA